MILKLGGRVTVIGPDVPSYRGKHGIIRAITGSGVMVLLDHEVGTVRFARSELARSDVPLLLGPYHRARIRDPLPRDERARLDGRVPHLGMTVTIKGDHHTGAWVCRFASLAQAETVARHTLGIAAGGDRFLRAIDPTWLEPLPLWANGPVPGNPHAPAWWRLPAWDAVPTPAPTSGPTPGLVALIVAYPDGEERRTTLAATELPAVEAALRVTPGIAYRVEAA